MAKVAPVRMAVISLFVAAVTVSGCSSDEPLLSSVSQMGSGSAGATSTDGSTEEESTKEDSLSGGQSIAQCLEGVWDIDKDSYLELFGGGIGPLAEGLSVSGDATVEFSGDRFINNYSDWVVAGNSPEGEMTLLMEGSETAQWSVDDSGVVTTTNRESTIESTLTVSMNGQQMVLPLADEDQQGLDLSTFSTACESDTMTLSGPEGFLVLNRR